MWHYDLCWWGICKLFIIAQWWLICLVQLNFYAPAHLCLSTCRAHLYWFLFLLLFRLQRRQQWWLDGLWIFPLYCQPICMEEILSQTILMTRAEMAGMIMPAVRMMPLSGNNIVSWFGRIVVTYYHLCFKKDMKGETFWRSWKRLCMMVQIVRLLGGLSSHLFFVWDMKLANWYVWKIDHTGFWFIVTLICHHFSNVSDNSSSNGEWLQNSNCDAGDAYERSWSECLIIQVIARALRSFFRNSCRSFVAYNSYSLVKNMQSSRIWIIIPSPMGLCEIFFTIILHSLPL